MKRFYEARVEPHSDNTVALQLILTRTETSCEHVKIQRPPSWAVCSCRFTVVPSDRVGLSADDDAVTLTMATGLSRRDKPGRYARVVILREGPDDKIEPTVHFFRTWLPELIREERVFVSTLDRPAELCEAEELEKAVQEARSVM